MKLYFIRHGEWHERLDRFSLEGEAQVTKTLQTVRGLRLKGKDVLVLTSPRKRAMETAKVVCRELGREKPIEAPWLSGEKSTEEMKTGFSFLTKTGSFEDVPALFIVGHNPHLETLIEFLTGRRVIVGNGDVWEVDLETKTATQLG